MVKAKKKRLAKDLAKLWRTGKYWEWVQLVSQTDQLNLYQAQWQEAWCYLSRQALRLPGQLEEFWPRLEAQPHVPNLPDLAFIRCLKDFFAGHTALPDIAALSGLSPAAQMLRGKLLSWSPDSRQDRKISRFLNLLIQQPDKVSGKTFNDLAALVKPNPLATSLISLGKTINQIRKLNRKDGFNPHLVAMGKTELKRADNKLSRLASTWNPTIRTALLHPFCFQLWQCLQGLWAKEDFDKIVYLTSCLPFLCSQTLGPEAAQLEAHSRQQSEAFFSEAEKLAFLEQSWSQGLDAMALALGKIRRRLGLEGLSDSRRLLAKFYATYLRFLTEVGRLQADLTSREKVDLVRLLDPILFQDQRWLREDEDLRLEFLRQAFASGAAGTRMSILTLLAPNLYIPPSFRRQAREYLQQFHYPGDPLIEEIFTDPKMIPVPEIHLLKPLFELYPHAAGMRQIILDHTLTSLNILLLSSAVTIQQEKSHRVKKEMLDIFQHNMGFFSQSLAELQDYAEIRPLEDLTACFPEGYYTSEGYQRLLQRLYDRSRSLAQLLNEIEHYVNIADLQDLLDSPFIYFFSSRWLEAHETLLWQFINDHLADLETASLDALQQLAATVSTRERLGPPAANFLLHLANLLQRRLRAGETGAEPLYDQIMSTLINWRQTGLPRRPRK